MRLEYLCKSEENRKLIEEIQLDSKIQYVTSNAKDLPLLSFSISGTNEDSAKLLFETKEKISKVINNNETFLLLDESGEYFNKRLYPLYNKFERLLRKVIFLVATKENNVSALEIAKKIETLTFGEIYESVFTSKLFREEVKLEITRNTNNIFSKQEILDRISALEEETLWGKMFSNNFTFISQNFFKLKSFRNDIMHAHNITYASFQNALKMIEKANKELETIISNYQDLI